MSITQLNQQVRLVKRPIGVPQATDFEITTEPIPEILGGGDVVVKNEYISLDPAMRGWMNVGKSYIEPVNLGDVMRAGGVGRVVASSNEKFLVGDFVGGMLGVQDFAVVAGGKGIRKIDASVAPLSYHLGTLGMTGMTAYFGLFDVCEPKPGDVVVVSGAAGAVGTVVGQLAKLHGCTVIGIAGGEDKCNFLTEQLGFDAAIDHRKGNVRSALRRAAPEGIDVYFDNVGGETLDTALSMLRPRARVAICGAVSQYNSTTGVSGPKNYLSLLVNRAKMEGFVVFDYAPRYGEAIEKMGKWLKEGKMKHLEHIVEGEVTDFLPTLLTLFEGDKLGKLVLKLK